MGGASRWNIFSEKGLTLDYYKKVIMLPDVPLDELGLFCIAKLWGQHFTVIMKDYVWTTGIGVTVEDCAIIFAYVGNLVFVDTVDVDARRAVNSGQYDTPYYSTDPQQAAVNLSITNNDSSTPACSNGEMHNITDFLAGLLNKNGLTMHGDDVNAPTTPLSTNDPDVSEAGAASETQLGIRNQVESQSPTSVPTETGAASQTQLGMQNQVESKSAKSVPTDTGAALETQLGMQNQVESKSAKSVQSNKTKNRKRQQNRGKSTSLEPPKKKKKRHIVTPKRNLHCSY